MFRRRVQAACASKVNAAIGRPGASSGVSTTRTDTDDRLLIAAVSPVNLHDCHGGIALLRTSRRLWPFLAHCFADTTYRGERVGRMSAITIEIVVPEEGQKGFAVQPRRRVIEGTIGWISRCRRLARDHEATPSSALTFSILAAAVILVR
jgi:transposase